jgi:hypothetical protein
MTSLTPGGGFNESHNLVPVQFSFALICGKDGNRLENKKFKNNHSLKLFSGTL